MTPIRKRLILDVEEEETAEESADQSPLAADDAPAGHATVQVPVKGPAMLPVEVADNEASEEPGDEIANDPGAQPSSTQPRKLKSEIEPVGATEIELDADEGQVNPPGWKLPPAKPRSAGAPSIASARRGRHTKAGSRKYLEGRPIREEEFCGKR